MTAYLSLGSNIGCREQYIDDACQRIEQQCGTILRCSDHFYSEPWGYQSEHQYLNVCLCLETDLSPIDLLNVTQDIERQLGRTVKNCYSDRTIDIDILLFYQSDGAMLTVDTPRLTLPHRHMYERDFVLVPLQQIAHDELLHEIQQRKN